MTVPGTNDMQSLSSWLMTEESRVVGVRHVRVRPILETAIFGSLHASSIEREMKPKLTFLRKGDLRHRQKKLHIFYKSADEAVTASYHLNSLLSAKRIIPVKIVLSGITSWANTTNVEFQCPNIIFIIISSNSERWRIQNFKYTTLFRWSIQIYLC